MKKILIQYLYIFIITLIILLIFTWANACEVEEIKVDETLPICEEYQVSTEETPCRKDNVDINTLSDALNKLGESGTIPK
jgi:uncharacterized membrane protein (DUF106 family)